MNPTPQITLFEPGSCPDGDQLRAYAQQTLAPEAQHALERHLLDCPLCQDAVEGFALVPVSASAIEELRSEAQHIAMAGGSGTSLFKGAKWWLGAGFTAILLGFITWQVVETDPVEPPMVSETEISLEKISKEHFIRNAPEEVQESDETITEETTLEPQKMAAPNTENKAVEPVMTENSTQVENTTSEILERKTDPVAPAPTLPVAEVPLERTNIPATPKEVPPLKYIEQYKTVDYAERDNTIQVAQVTSGSTPPQYANSEQAKKRQPEVLTFQYSYNDVLELGIFRLKAGKYRKALQKFNLILKHFPEDENALFYGGLSYFNLGQYEQSIAFFDQISGLQKSYFDEEAEWYKALAFLKIGQRKEAKTIMVKISEAGGFYAERASKKLSEL
ncbi:MAG: tetratricopeptide repeat protein [Salibacteraceae bacterium]